MGKHPEQTDNTGAGGRKERDGRGGKNIGEVGKQRGWGRRVGSRNGGETKRMKDLCRENEGEEC